MANIGRYYDEQYMKPTYSGGPGRSPSGPTKGGPGRKPSGPVKGGPGRKPTGKSSAAPMASPTPPSKSSSAPATAPTPKAAQTPRAMNVINSEGAARTAATAAKRKKTFTNTQFAKLNDR